MDNNTAIMIQPLSGAEPVKLTINIVKKYLATPTRSGQLPSDRDCLRFAMLCRAQGLNPFECDCYLTGYDGKNGPEFSMITAISSFEKRRSSDDRFDGEESGIIYTDAKGVEVTKEGARLPAGGTLVGGWCRVWLKGISRPIYKELDFNAYCKRTADGRPTKFWASDGPGQIVKCARSQALRAAFPDRLGGLYTKDEAHMSDEDTIMVDSEIVEDQPAEQIEKPKQRKRKSAVVETEVVEPDKTNGKALALESAIKEAGYTFADFRRWADETGNLNPEDAKSYDELSSDTLERLSRRPGGIIAALKAADIEKGK